MANERSAGQRALELARLAVQRTGFDVARDPFHRFVHALHGHRIECVVDIGANTGQFGRQLRRTGYTGRIHSVEPLASAYAALARTCASDPSWTASREAVSDRPGTVTMNVSANSVSSSVLPILDRSTASAPATAYVGTEEVPATTVDELLPRLGADPARTLVKIDVQGYEQSVLAGAAASLPDLAGVRCELSLVPLYEGQPLLPELVASLAASGFGLWLVEPGWVEAGTGRMLQLDGTFFRD
jgi:FkbM family methyltransferase